MEQYIKVIGKGKSEAYPDGIRMYIQMQTDGETYDHAVGSMAAIAEKMGKDGEMPEMVQVLNLEVEMAEQESYRCSAEFCAEFPAEPERCATGLRRLSGYSCRPTVTAEYYVRNAKKQTQTALEKAVEDARNCAQVLAAAAGKKLGALRKIEQLPQSAFHPQTILEMELGSPEFAEGDAAKALFDSLVPGKIQVAQEVEMCWELCPADACPGKR